MSAEAKKSVLILPDNNKADKKKVSSHRKDFDSKDSEASIVSEKASFRTPSKVAPKPAAKLIPNRMIKSVSPIGMRVLVKLINSDNKTQAGLYLPEGAKEEQEESVLAEVVEVASAIDEETDEDTNISGIPLGSTVLISREVGVKVPWDDSLLLVETGDVLALVEEFQVS